ncbi:MAG: hypothetical protein ABFD54_17980 [Armatimonadota bacterium]|nr:hypothetical protein [bacterium]
MSSDILRNIIIVSLLSGILIGGCWIILVWLNLSRFADNMRTSAALNHENIILGPDKVLYNEGGFWNWHNGCGVAMFIGQQIIFKNVINEKTVVFPIDMIISVSTDNRPFISYMNAIPHFFLDLKGGKRVCFLSKKRDAWVQAINQRLTLNLPSPPPIP